MDWPSVDQTGDNANAASWVSRRTLPEPTSTISNSPVGPPKDAAKATLRPSGEKRGPLFPKSSFNSGASRRPFCPKASEIHIAPVVLLRYASQCPSRDQAGSEAFKTKRREVPPRAGTLQRSQIPESFSRAYAISVPSGDQQGVFLRLGSSVILTGLPPLS